MVRSYCKSNYNYNVIKSQKADIIELHFDLEGLGWEEKRNHHCWLPEELKNY